MKRVIILIFLAVFYISKGDSKSPPEDPKPPQPCVAYATDRSFQNIQASGDQLIGTNVINSLSDFLNLGCIIDLTVKASKGCSYTWTKTYTKHDSHIIGNNVKGIMIPNTTDYTITIKVESPCLKDNFLGRDVKLVWTKIFNSLTPTASTDLGYPTKADCASTRTSSGRSAVVNDYQSSGRVASSISREIMLQEAIY